MQIYVMIPFGVTAELLNVKKIMSSVGLIRSASFKLFMMVEIQQTLSEAMTFLMSALTVYRSVLMI